MTTRLNKTLIEEIVASVIAATTFKQQRDALEKRIRAHASALLTRDAPPGLVDLSKTVPREWLYWVDNVWMSRHDWNPSLILAKAFEPAPYCVGARIAVEPAVPTTAERNEKLREADFAALTAEATALAEAYLRTKSQLHAVLNSVRTVEAALKRMPELEPHIPKIAKSYPLATTSNLLADLMAFGFTVRAEQSA